jgi:hypothetical protein
MSADPNTRRNDTRGAVVESTVRKLMLFLLLAMPLGVANAEIMPLTEVQKGQKGYGLTVFDGSKVERFDVEILGVLRNIGPNQDLILANVDSEVIRRTGVMAGMSGSPIYIDGKVIGALAYSWQFAKEPVAGITPIEEMLAISRNAASAGPRIGPQMTSNAFLTTFGERKWEEQFQKMTASVFAGNPGFATAALPIATPLSLGRFSANTIERFSPMLEMGGFLPVPSGTTSSATSKAKASGSATPFTPGAAVGAVLVDGDFSVAATGTVTHVDGAAVYGFGHPFLGMGEISVPMAKAEVVALLPSVARSFKFANTGEIVGSFRQDRAAGIYGVEGSFVDMIPVNLTLEGSRGREEYKLRVIQHPELFPVFVAMAADSVIANAQRSAGERTVVLESTVEIEGFAPLTVRDGWSGAQARASIPAYLAVISNYLLSNEFSDAKIKSLNITLRHDDRLKTARLVEASVETPGDGEVNPGDTVRVNALLKPFRGEEFRESFDIVIPSTQKAGTAHVLIGGGSVANQLGFTLVPPDPRTLEQVLGVVRRLRSSTDLTASLFTSSPGVVAGGSYLPNVPPSMTAVIQTDSSNSAQAPVRYDTTQQLVRQLEYVVDGALTLDIEIRPRI